MLSPTGASRCFHVAEWLHDVAASYNRDDFDDIDVPASQLIAQLADTASEFYGTVTLWDVFVDLLGWTEADEYEPVAGDMSAQVRASLYRIAERLLLALLPSE